VRLVGYLKIKDITSIRIYLVLRYCGRWYNVWTCLYCQMILMPRVLCFTHCLLLS